MHLNWNFQFTIPQNPFPKRFRLNLNVLKKAKKKFCCKVKPAKFAAVITFKKTNMNKADLINKIADDTGITKTQANAAIDSFTEAVTKTLRGGGKVTLVGFGTFLISKRKARKGRNPQTKEEITIKARKVARFKAGKELASKL